jgi:hypothetical protein
VDRRESERFATGAMNAIVLKNETHSEAR